MILHVAVLLLEADLLQTGDPADGELGTVAVVRLLLVHVEGATFHTGAKGIGQRLAAQQDGAVDGGTRGLVRLHTS
ncbi:hypothetical protein D3C79_989210 [compost metagenome]